MGFRVGSFILFFMGLMLPGLALRRFPVQGCEDMVTLLLAPASDVKPLKQEPDMQSPGTPEA